MKRAAFLLALVVLLLLLVGNALAMQSASYWLDWYTPGTGGGGGPADSASYAVNFTVGQTAIGTMSSTNYRGCLGYWRQAGGGGESTIHLPVILRN